MARYYGSIGFAVSEESRPGVWRDMITEKKYKGMITRNSVRWSSDSDTSDKFRVDNAISVIADPYIEAHVSDIRYAVWLGQKWKVSSVQINSPRIVLQLSGEYNG